MLEAYAYVFILSTIVLWTIAAVATWFVPPWVTVLLFFGLLIPSIVDDYADLGDAVDGVFKQAADDMAGTGFANMCPVASVAAEVADTVEDLRDTAASVFTAWIDGGTAYFLARGLDASQAREVTLALISALEGAFVLARTLRSTDSLLAVGAALAPRYRGVTLSPRSAVAVGAG